MDWPSRDPTPSAGDHRGPPANMTHATSSRGTSTSTNVKLSSIQWVCPTTKEPLRLEPTAAGQLGASTCQAKLQMTGLSVHHGKAAVGRERGSGKILFGFRKLFSSRTSYSAISSACPNQHGFRTKIFWNFSPIQSSSQTEDPIATRAPVPMNPTTSQHENHERHGRVGESRCGPTC